MKWERVRPGVKRVMMSHEDLCIELCGYQDHSLFSCELIIQFFITSRGITDQVGGHVVWIKHKLGRMANFRVKSIIQQHPEMFRDRCVCVWGEVPQRNV
jgi:hypothetical protein